jgi:hypothetical protein
MGGVNASGRAASDAVRLVDQVTATWLTLDSCRALVDDGTRAMIDDAMAALDEVGALARTLRVVAPDAVAAPWLGDLSDVDELACDIYRHVRDATTEGGR